MLMLARARTRSCLSSTLPGLIQFGTRKITFRHDSSSSNQRRESHGLALALFLEEEQASEQRMDDDEREEKAERSCLHTLPASRSLATSSLHHAQHDRTHGRSTQPHQTRGTISGNNSSTHCNFYSTKQSKPLIPAPYPLHSTEPLTKHNFRANTVFRRLLNGQQINLHRD